jgi:hypothetical protein
MPETLIEKAKRLADKKVKAAEKLKAEKTKAGKAAAREREVNEEIERQTAWVLGKSLLALLRADKLTPQQHVALGQMLALVEEKPHNWELLAAYQLPPITRNPAERDAA